MYKCIIYIFIIYAGVALQAQQYKYIKFHSSKKKSIRLEINQDQENSTDEEIQNTAYSKAGKVKVCHLYGPNIYLSHVQL